MSKFLFFNPLNQEMSIADTSIINFLKERSYILYILVLVPSFWFVVEILFLCIVHFKLSPSLQRLKKVQKICF